jgi:hypothetical protein
MAKELIHTRWNSFSYVDDNDHVNGNVCFYPIFFCNNSGQKHKKKRQKISVLVCMLANERTSERRALSWLVLRLFLFLPLLFFFFLFCFSFIVLSLRLNSNERRKKHNEKIKKLVRKKVISVWIERTSKKQMHMDIQQALTNCSLIVHDTLNQLDKKTGRLPRQNYQWLLSRFQVNKLDEFGKIHRHEYIEYLRMSVLFVHQSTCTMKTQRLTQ